METGLAWLHGQQQKHMVRTIQYQRGMDSLVIEAALGRTEFEQADDFGIVRRSESRDYLIRAIDLVLSDGQTVPRTGDRIKEVGWAGATIYEVRAPNNETPYRFTDPYNTRLRVHTKLIGTE